MLTGSDKPPIVNRELFEVAAVTVTSAPVALRAPAAVPLLPMTTSPAANVAGVAVNCAVVRSPGIAGRRGFRRTEPLATQSGPEAEKNKCQVNNPKAVCVTTKLRKSIHNCIPEKRRVPVFGYEFV